MVPNLRCWTFRYWTVRASDVLGIGSSPAGGKMGNFSTDFDQSNLNLSIQPATPLQSFFKMHPVYITKPNNVRNMSAHVCIYAILMYILYTKNPKKLIKKRGYHQLKVQHFIMPAGCLEITFIIGIDRDPDPSTIWTRTRIFQNCTIPRICLQFL
jgi:hypothetical protein